jgi:type IV pilus biogenesis protein CpaD/CtpE
MHAPFVLIVAGVAVSLLAACGHGPASETAATPATAATTAPATTLTAATTATTLTAAAPATSRPTASQSPSQLALIDHVHWASTTKGRQLQVFPTAAGRTDDSAAASGRAWAEVLADAPNANSAGMHDQFLCHWNFARVIEPNKPSWNLEPWRTAVGYAATVSALCNPGGNEG